ncbi:MAG: NAD(P)-dependent oxidoreductase [Vicinamibacterales bacterium]
MKVGYVGLGNMGGFVAGHILKRGHDLAVCDLRPEKVDALKRLGAKAASSVVELAEACDLVLICVESLAAVETVLFGPAGVAAARRRPQLVVDNSTIPPGSARAFAARLGEMGIGYVDAPFSGGVTGARDGTLAVMAGGATEHFEVARPVLECFSGRINYMGPAGSGQAAKACNQVIDFATVACIGEAIAFGRAFGIDVDRLPAVVEGGLADSALMREYAREKREGAGPSTALIEGIAELLEGTPELKHSPAFKICLKDLDIVIETARDYNVAVPVTGLACSLIRMLETRSSRSKEMTHARRNNT